MLTTHVESEALHRYHFALDFQLGRAKGQLRNAGFEKTRLCGARTGEIDMMMGTVRQTLAAWLCASVAALAGCDVFIQCSPGPPDSAGVCDLVAQSCDEGSAEPVPDTRQDGATDIAQFSPGHIPADVLLNVPNEGRVHIAADLTPTYQFNPPASGPHFDTPAPAGFYCEALAPGHWVHDLEHGYIVILFDESHAMQAGFVFGGFRSALDMVRQLAPKSPTFGNAKVLVAPYAGLEHPICLIAWNRQLYLDQVDVGAILSFCSTYLDQGPEQEL